MACRRAPTVTAYVLSLFLMVSLCPLSYHSHVVASPGVLSFDIHHRFSSNVRRWARDDTDGFWPEKGSVQYYDWLFSHDKALLHRRGLAGEEGQTLTFADGNATVQFGGKLGFLHYANISLGKPKVDILVALDTGSDLLWVPCTNTSIYRSASSSTSKKVSCNSSLCQQQLLCTRPSDSCPYQVRYLDGTSSSGVLTEDLLYLTTTDSTQQQQSVNASVTFGCTAAATNGFTFGIFGLGFSKISVPSTLVNAGLVSDSFSMCFGLTDEVGRINFGDKGGLDQMTTPLAPNVLNQDYVVTVKAINVKDLSVSEDFFAVVDSGSSFTILKDPTYTTFAEMFNSQVVDDRFPRIPELPFEYCYQPPSLNLSSIKPPNVSLSMEGGSNFPFLSSIVAVSVNDATTIYCLGIIKNENLNIIGQNFMAGLKLVFDRENLVLGWKEFNCYDVENSTATSGTTPGTPNNITPSPVPAPPSNRGTENGVAPRSMSSLLLVVVFFVLLLA